MAPFRGFVGGSYTTLAPGADAERSINLYPERIESAGGAEKSGGFVLYSKPGLKLFVALPDCTAITDECELNGRVFALGKSGANTLLFEVFQNGTATQRGGALPGDVRGQLCPGEVEVLLLLGGNGYSFNLAANTVTRITAAAFPAGATKGGFLDGYFVVIEPKSQLFAISGLNDLLSWNTLDFDAVNGAPGNVISLMPMYRQLWFLCVNRGEVYYDSGNADFPFTRLENGIFEQGTAAVDSPAKFDNTLMWLGKNEDGGGIVWRADGYIPRRVSTHAIETLIASYGTISDARGYTYQERGHTFYVLHFPSANAGLGATVVYDVSSGFWHERGWWDQTLGAYRADLARSHAFAWSKHLVGDYRSGNIYEQSMLFASDNGTAMRRLRAAPDLARGGKWTFYHALRLLCQAGVGPDGGSPDITTTQNVTVLGTAACWSFAGGINSQWAEGFVSAGTPPTSVAVTPGAYVAIQYVSGTANDGGAETSYDGNGNNFPNSPTGPNSWPTRYMPGSLLGTMGLLGCFADAAGNVVQPLSIGNFATFTVPSGATQLQLGMNDSDLHNNNGSYLVSVSVSTVNPEALAFTAYRDPQIVLQLSNDGGKTWGRERTASLGKIGEYRTLVCFPRLGRSRNRAFRSICSAPVLFAIFEADIDAEATDR